jgi:tetratricopeptide (TPR) repeat protein
MAYVRKRGRQLLIVQGTRDSQTGMVGQRILFTIYSKAEALRILGQNKRGTEVQFRNLLQHQFPDIKFDWRKILEGIKADLHVLPELYEYRETRLKSGFRKDLCSFARQLMLADPQDLFSAANLIREHSVEFDYLIELIRWRLNLCKQERNEWNTDNPFYWRFATQGSEVPSEIEEQVAGFYERGEFDRAAVLFRFLIDCFDNYAEGYNYLGLISLKTGKLEDAIENFRKTMDLGRKYFPKRMARSRYWSDHATRPYMRGMRNITLALNRAGRYDEALEYCDQLEKECGDEFTPASYRALIYLNTNRWREAADSALRLQNIDASESLLAAFALSELGCIEDAASCFLHGALNFPRSAKILVGIQTKPPKNHDEAVDNNAGVDIRKDLHKYLSASGRKSIRFFKCFFETPRVSKLLSEMEAAKKRWAAERHSEKREAYDLMMQMQTPSFARQEAKELLRSVALLFSP